MIFSDSCGWKKISEEICFKLEDVFLKNRYRVFKPRKKSGAVEHDQTRFNLNFSLNLFLINGSIQIFLITYLEQSALFVCNKNVILPIDF